MKKLSVLAVLLLLSACATTGDPHQGGLFGWSSEKADQRLDERSANLNDLQAQNQAEQENTRRLTLEATAGQQELAEWQGKIKALDGENAALKKRLGAYQAKNKKQRTALAKLRAKQAELQRETAAVKEHGGDTAAGEAEAERLRQQVEKLSKDFEALSRL